MDSRGTLNVEDRESTVERRNQVDKVALYSQWDECISSTVPSRTRDILDMDNEAVHGREVRNRPFQRPFLVAVAATDIRPQRRDETKHHHDGPLAKSASRIGLLNI